MHDITRFSKDLECQREASIAHTLELSEHYSLIERLLVLINLLEDYRASFIGISSQILPSSRNKSSISLEVKNALLCLETLNEAQPPPLHHALLEAPTSGLLHIINSRTKDDLTAASNLLTELEDKGTPNITNNNITTTANTASTALRQHQIDSYKSTKQLQKEITALKDKLQSLIKSSRTFIPETSIMRAGLLGITHHISSQLDCISGAEATIKATKQSIISVEQKIREGEEEEERLDKLLSKLARKDEQLLTIWKDYSSQAQEVSTTAINNSSKGEGSFNDLATLLHTAIYNELKALSSDCHGSIEEEGEEEGRSSPNNNNDSNNLIPYTTNQGLTDAINHSDIELCTKLPSLESWKASLDLVNAALNQISLLVDNDDGLEAEAEQFRTWQHKKGVDDLRKVKREAVHTKDVILREAEQALHNWWACPIVEAISWLKYDGKSMGEWVEGRRDKN